jgi:hypothetical protein
MKYLLIPTIVVFTIISPVIKGQDIMVSTVKNNDMVKFANESKIIAEKKNDNLAIKIILLGNLPGSAGYPNGEITDNLYVAVSEFGEYPEQNLFCISQFYNLKFLKWDNEKPKTINFIIEYGPSEKRERQAFEISLDKVKIISK